MRQISFINLTLIQSSEQLVGEKKKGQAEKRTTILPAVSSLPAAHRNLNTDRTGKIAFLGAFPRIARNIQNAFRTAVTD